MKTIKQGQKGTHGSLPNRWVLWCILNLLITAILGLTMRYKMLFPLPGVNMVNVLHAHVHFVFTGWVSLTLFSCVIAFILPKRVNQKEIYRILFFALEAASLGMLISYLIQGYGSVSITFTFISILIRCLFVFYIWRDLVRIEDSYSSYIFLKGGMIGFLLSLPGMFMLIYWNITGHGSPITIRAALYWFLHFQYNGWFTFAVFALLIRWLHKIEFPIPQKQGLIVFWLLFIGIIPGYCLSIIAFYPLLWIEICSILAVLCHFVAAIILFLMVVKDAKPIQKGIPSHINMLWKIATAAFFLKVLMQAGTLVPSLAKFSFAFRPLIIGYLHLTFLCFVSFFIIGYLLYFRHLRVNNSFWTYFGLVLFVISVLLMELGLFGESFFAFMGSYPKSLRLFVFWVTVGIVLGLLLFVGGQKWRKTKATEY